MHFDFDKDLLDGHDAEELVLALIQDKYPQAHRMEDYHPEFDIYVPETKTRIEVKHDLKSEETGNYFIETKYNNKDSGINTSQADFWVIVDKKHIVWIETEVLKALIKAEPEETYPAKGKDGERTGILIPKTKLIGPAGYAAKVLDIMI